MQFELLEVKGQAATIPGTKGYVIDHYDWLQLTVGRFLAPAELGRGGVQYLLLGGKLEEANPEEGQRTIDNEVNALERSLERLSEELSELVDDPDVSEAGILASLSAILELRLPPRSLNDKPMYHVRGGLLQITGWGLSSSDGRRLKEILGLGGDGRRLREGFMTDVRSALMNSARARPIRTPAALDGLHRSDARKELGRAARSSVRMSHTSSSQSTVPGEGAPRLRWLRTPRVLAPLVTALTRRSRWLHVLRVLATLALGGAIGWMARGRIQDSDGPAPTHELGLEESKSVPDQGSQGNDG